MVCRLTFDDADTLGENETEDELLYGLRSHKTMNWNILTGPRAALVLIGYLILVFIGSIMAQSAVAQEMTNSLYKIQMGNLNSIAGISGGENFKINITSGENTPGLYSGTNYKARLGFQYIPRKGGVFSFGISNTLIDFGTLTPTNPVTRTTTLTVSNTTAAGFTVTGSENHQLLVSKTGAIIPDTTCDKGTCSETTASEWNNSLTYGFGFRCDASSKGCVAEDLSFYQNPLFFKQFADSSKKEKAVKIISGGKGKNQKATVTYKVNISSNQPAGLYTNSITYIAIPTF